MSAEIRTRFNDDEEVSLSTKGDYRELFALACNALEQISITAVVEGDTTPEDMQSAIMEAACFMVHQLGGEDNPEDEDEDDE